MRDKINQLRAYAQWFRTHLDKSSSIDITIWNHNFNTMEDIEYSFYVEGIFDKWTYDIDELIDTVATVQKLYQNMEVAA